MKKILLLSLIAVLACGDDVTLDTDASLADASLADASLADVQQDTAMPQEPDDSGAAPDAPSTITDDDAVFRYNNDYNSRAPFRSKEDLNPQTASNGDTVYVFNQGGGDTSFPSCINGKKVNYDCAPTGWNLGVEAGEVWALRLITGDAYSVASQLVEQNTFSGGQTIQANYEYNISDVPGDMSGTPYEGKCSRTDVNSHGALLMRPSNGDADYCAVPAGTLMYINMRLAPSSEAFCSTGLCNGYFTLSGFRPPTTRGDP